MKKYLVLLQTFLFTTVLTQVIAQEKIKSDGPLSITKHKISINGKTINYTATTGYLVLREESGKARANIFFVAYTKDGVADPATRPITYSFNGGPGSSSVWLHMGALGPRRIQMTDAGESEAPPYNVIDNEYTWLDETDLVFIDPVTTGYSRPAEGVEGKEFHGYNEDIASVGDFIRLYTTQFERWSSPKFLAGESYGTTRSAGLSGYLQDRHGLYLNGIVLISAVLNFQTILFDTGNELPFALYLPTYSAIAWYHKKLSPEYTDLKKLLSEVEQFAMGEYSIALMKGDKLTDAEKQALTEKLNRYTGLSKEYIQQTHYRIEILRFTKELLRKEGRMSGRLDGRFKGIDYDNAGEHFEFDPSYNTAIYGPYTTAINDYVRRELKYENDLPYEVLTGRVHPWNYTNVQNRYLNVAETLRQSMVKNPFLKILVCNGYYDLATPYFATDYTFNHMFLDKSLQKNIKMTFYESGHMMYIHKPSLIQFRKDVSSFYKESLTR
ncbi:S10 family peptidase [Xanthocytophaga flava]|uniref:S10 family peptidase n=1 Tax=Xanthocytophaga flava TaxID=3048013 RepID=UPI0028D437A2|nr:peptidase S10 [Xanthocytophaga flavus]MDJ1471424.1 peptidase S10 [Xanthocytophaga flavus]